MCREGAWAELTVKVTYMDIGFEAACTVNVYQVTKWKLTEREPQVI